jgi:putative nucleotidyltransferase with HDIG domain
LLAHGSGGSDEGSPHFPEFCEPAEDLWLKDARRCADACMVSPVSVPGRSGLVTWFAATGGLIGAQLGSGFFVPNGWVFSNALLLFWVVVVAASGCLVAALMSLWAASRDDLPELGLMSGFAVAVSVLPLVHGITTPGVLYGSNPATMSSVLWAVPIGSVAVLPLIAPRSRGARCALRHWDYLVGIHIGLVMTVALILLKDPTLLPAPPMRSTASGLVAAVALGICLALSTRHLRLGWISKTNGPTAVAIGFSSLGASNLVWFASGPFTVAFWLAHALDVAGVFAITLIARRAYQQGRPIRSVLAPLIVQTPAAALELGLDPLVHRFVAALERKDQITRDHVVRTAALAIAVGDELGLPGEELHELGIGALLHDVGKLGIPDSLINKPGRLTEDEVAVMRRHVTAGEELVRQSRVLQRAMPIIRGHHERVDGAGYPDGLRDEHIPFLARIVAVCDAYDAMANTRQYRSGMGHEKACAILREHAGAQWDAVVVEAVIAVQARRPVSSQPLQSVGRNEQQLGEQSERLRDFDAWCGCGDALPEPVPVPVGAF